MPRLRALTILIVVLSATHGASARAERPRPEAFKDVSAFIRGQVDQGRIPSAAVGVVTQDGTIWAEAFGLADRERKTRATLDTTYWLASVSKPITATGLMVLVDRHAIDLDAPANRYLVGSKLRAYVGSADAITIRRLANHSSGLPQYHDFFHDGIAPPSRDETIRRYGFAAWGPGTRWEYCNLAFGILDHITANVAGRPWRSFMEEAVFDPLGMTRTSDHSRPGRERDAAVQYNLDLAGHFVPVAPYAFDHPGASAIVSSVNDLARFVRMHLNEGALDGVRVLSPAAVREMQRRTSTRPGRSGQGTGVGWGVDSVRGHRSISHTGGMPGVATLVRLFPDEGYGVIVLVNAGGSAPVTQIGDRLTGVLFPESQKNEPPATGKSESANDDAGIIKAWKGKWTGRIVHPDGPIPMNLEVIEPETLRVRLGDGESRDLADPSLRIDRLRGATDGWLGAVPNFHGPVLLTFQLDRKDDRLTGVAAMDAGGYFHLPHFVELTRESRPKPDADGIATRGGDPAFDVLITNGRIVDGCGTPWYRGDIGLRAGKIAAIGRLKGAKAERTIDAAGLVVAPGFFDLMGQTASPFLKDARAGDNLLTQGITTINCGEGESAAPLGPRDAAAHGWRTMAEYFNKLDSAGMPLNAVQTVGHTQVRMIVIGDVDRKATAEELEQMKALVAEGMDAGAIGLSTSLIYPPAVYAPTEEIVALAKVAGERGGRYYTHMRNEGDRLLEAIDEALLIGRDSGAPVHIFHLKTAGRQNWGKMDLALARISAARAAGQQVAADIYPYINNGLSLRSFIHPRHAAEGEAALIRKLDDPATRAAIRADFEGPEPWENWYRHIGSDWNNVVVAGMTEAPYAGHSGKPLAEVATAVGKDPWDTFYELCKTSTFALPKTMTEANLIKAMRQEFICFDTDVGPTGGSLIAKHPRAFGSFPRVLGRFTRDLGVLSLEAAIQRMTSVAANELGIRDRGRLVPGLAADIVLFDFERITDHATLAEPGIASEGVRWVIINGKVVLDDGKPTAAKPGRVLRGPGYRKP